MQPSRLAHDFVPKGDASVRDELGPSLTHRGYGRTPLNLLQHEQLASVLGGHLHPRQFRRLRSPLRGVDRVHFEPHPRKHELPERVNLGL